MCLYCVSVSIGWMLSSISMYFSVGCISIVMYACKWKEYIVIYVCLSCHECKLVLVVYFMYVCWSKVLWMYVILRLCIVLSYMQCRLCVVTYRVIHKGCNFNDDCRAFINHCFNKICANCNIFLTVLTFVKILINFDIMKLPKLLQIRLILEVLGRRWSRILCG